MPCPNGWRTPLPRARPEGRRNHVRTHDNRGGSVLHGPLLRGKRSRATFTTMLMFWGAALMWSVDCVANRLDGEPLFDLSREDALLGGIILAAGLLVHVVLTIRERRALRGA